MTPREYRLHLTWSQKLTVALPLLAFTVAPLVAYAVTVTLHLRVPAPFFLAPMAYGAFLWWILLTTPHRVRVTQSGQLEFVSVLRRQAIPVSEIISVAPQGSAYSVSPFGHFVLSHRNGRVGFVAQFTGLHALLGELRQANSNIELIGC